jgi:hypothetical protein
MMKKIMLTVLILVTPVFVSANYMDNTLGDNKQVPNKLMGQIMDEAIANSMLDTPYIGFYRIDGKVKNNKIRFERVQDKYSYPDHSLESLAVGLMSLIEIPVYSTGSRIKTRATAYVAMYNGTPDQFGLENAVTIPTSLDAAPNTTVLVIIKQKEMSNAKNANMRLANSELGKRDGSQAYFFQLAI